MTAHTKGSGLKWVGRAIRRLEDPALITGQGRFTADLPAAHWVRFVRSPVAAGRIVKVAAPKGTMVITAADLKGVKKITPMLHKFNYKPVGQPVLADGAVRFVGEPVAAAIAASAAAAEDIAEQVELIIDETAPVIDAQAALAPGAPQVHAEAPGNVILEGKFKTPDFDAAWSSAAKIVKFERALAPAECDADGGARRPRCLRCGDRPGDADLHHTDAASHAYGDCRPARHAGGRPARHRARRRRRLRAEDVARARIRRAGLAGAQAQEFGRLERGPARKPDRRLSRPRSIPHARRRLRQGCQAHRAQGRRGRQCRRLFLLSHHLRRRAADGHGRAARPVRFPFL